jgi:Holliday junction resolvasome RuvABC endonuclease subunit
MIVMGVDPGAVSAAWGLIPPDMDGGVLSAVCAEVETAGKMVDARGFGRTVLRYRPTHAVVERVHSFPGQGVSSSFRFGCGYGMILGVVHMAGLVVVDVSPTVWKKHFKLGPDKEEARTLAIKRFPNASLSRKKDAGKAEALLMALWLREAGYG